MCEKYFYLLALCGFFICVEMQMLPVNPCPNLFKYFQSNNVIYGRMEFQNDLSGNYRLTVNMSVGAYIGDNKNIRLELQTSANELVMGRPVIYNVYFPIQFIIPRPTKVEFNNQIYCIGPPEPLYPGRNVTYMWATTFFKITYQQVPSIITEAPVVQTFTTAATPFERPATLPPATQPPPTIPWTTQSAAPPQQPIFTFSPTPPRTPTSSFSPTTSLRPTSSFVPTPSRRPSPSLFTSPPIATTEAFDANPNLEECGVSSITSQQLVVNGESVLDAQFPWMVALMYRENFNYKYRCTGTLVSKRHIITAGHCLQYYKAPLFPFEDLLLVFGKQNIASWANGGLLRDVMNISVHPDYQQNKGDCDIAVITVSKSIEFEESVRPVCMWQGDDDLDNIVGQNGVVAGWGRDESGKEFVPDAKKVTMPVVSQVDCLRSDPGFSSITSSRTFCAGKKNGAGPCAGDSGAGFIMNKNGKWTIRGVVSTALGDVSVCDVNNYSVFVDIAKVKKWVDSIMS